MQQFFILLSWRLFMAHHVSGIFLPIIRSSMTAVATCAVIELLMMGGENARNMLSCKQTSG
jgi:hypothetical protein